MPISDTPLKVINFVGVAPIKYYIYNLNNVLSQTTQRIYILTTPYDYELKLFGNRNGFEVVNTFYYVDEEAGGSASDLRAVFLTSVFPAIRDIVSSSVDYTRIYTRSLVTASNFDDESLSVSGTRSSQINNLIDRWYFKFKRSTNGYNDGKKLIGLVADFDVEDNAPTSTALVNLAIAETAMSGFLTTFVGTYAPCNARYLANPPDSEHENVWYTIAFLEEVRGVEFIRLSHKV